MTPEKADYRGAVAERTEALRIIEQSGTKLRLLDIELRYLAQLKQFLSAPPEWAGLIDCCQSSPLRRFRISRPQATPSNYLIGQSRDQ